MRTKEQFSSIWKDLNQWVEFHGSPVWLVPKEDGYSLSVIKPEPSELPYGTASNFYDKNLGIIDTVKSSKSLF